MSKYRTSSGKGRVINNQIVVTSKYIYNQDTTNTNWKYFEYHTGALVIPESVVHIQKIPYIFENGLLSPLDIIKTWFILQKKLDGWMDIISHAQEFDTETILLGEKNGRWTFKIFSLEKEYSWVFDRAKTSDIKIYKLNGAYIFVSPQAVYIYYKGAKEIVKILDDVEIIQMVDAKIFFNKNGGSYIIDLLRKEK